MTSAKNLFVSEHDWQKSFDHNKTICLWVSTISTTKKICKAVGSPWSCGHCIGLATGKYVVQILETGTIFFSVFAFSTSFFLVNCKFQIATSLACKERGRGGVKEKQKRRLSSGSNC